MERLVRSRSYPGFSIGILLSVKMILPVNSVFIPLLNEIHSSMERERGNRRWRESERERHDKEKRKLPLPSPSFFLPPSSLQFVLPLDIQQQMKIQRGINNFYQTGANEIDYFIQFFIPEASLTPFTQQPHPCSFIREKKKKVLYANQMLYS